MMRGGRSLALSVAGHVGGLALLAVLANRLAPPALPITTPKNTVEIVFEAPPPAAPPAPSVEPPPPAAEPPMAEPPPVPEPPPIPEPPPPALEPPPVPVLPAPPPPPPKTKPPARRVLHQPRVAHRPAPEPKRPPPEPRMPTALPAAPQAAALPPPVARPAPAPAPAAAAPAISAGYRGALSNWLESHKHYPDSARMRGEEGRVVLRFRVDRSGRVLDYAIVGSSEYPELDAAVEAMMRGATLPPFPAEMTAADIEVTVTVRFGLSR